MELQKDPTGRYSLIGRADAGSAGLFDIWYHNGNGSRDPDCFGLCSPVLVPVTLKTYPNLPDLLKDAGARVTLAYWFDAILDGSEPVEVDSNLKWYALEVVPPIYAAGCFGVGEAHSFRDGQDTRHWFAERGGKSYGYLGTKREAESHFSKVKA